MAQMLMIGMMVAGGAMNAAGNVMAANAKADADLYNAQRADENAKLTLEQTDQEVEREHYKNTQTLGSIRAAYGASGLVMDGSAQDYADSQAMIGLKNELAIKHKGILDAKAYSDQAQQYRNAAGADRTGGILGGIGSGLSGVGNVLKRTA